MTTVSLALWLGLGGGIVWDAPPPCPEAPTIERRVAEAGIEEPPSTRARVEVREAGSVWQLEVEFGDAPARVVEGESCDALADALVAMIILQGDGSQSLDEVEPAMPPPTVPGPPSLPATAPPPTTAPPREQPRALPPPAAPRRRPSRRGALLLGVEGGIHGLGIPGPGGGAGLRLGVAFDRLRLSGYGQWWFRRTKPVRIPIEATYRLAVAGLEACGVATFGRLEALGCGVFEFGELRAQGLRAAPSRTKRHLWVAPGAVGNLQWRIRNPVRLGLGVAALAPLARRQFAVGDLTAGEVGSIELRGLLHVLVVVPRGRREKNPDVR